MSDSNRTTLAVVKEASFAPAIAAASRRATLTAAGQPAATETVVINSRTYTFVETAATLAENKVLVGDSIELTLKNLEAAINALPGAGVRYGTATAVHADVFAEYNEDNASLTIYSKAAAASAFTLSSTATNLTWGAQTAGAAANLTGNTLRFNSESLVHTKETIASEAIRDDRSTGSLIEVGIGASGGLTMELIHTAYNDFLMAGLAASAWTSYSETLSVTASLAEQSISLASGEFHAHLQGAKLVQLSGFAAAGNNGIKRVVSNNGVTIKLAPGSLTADVTVAADATIGVNYIRNGTTTTSFMLERYMIGAASYMQFRGMCVDQLALTLEARRKAMMNLTFLGYSGESRGFTALSTNNAASTNPVFTASNNIGAVLMDGYDTLCPVNRFTLTVANNMRNRFALARKGTLTPGMGDNVITGQIGIYFENRALLEYFLNHRHKSMMVWMTDANRNAISFHLPRISFPNANPNISGLNQDIILPMDYRALKYPDSSTGYQLQIDNLTA